MKSLLAFLALLVVGCSQVPVVSPLEVNPFDAVRAATYKVEVGNEKGNIQGSCSGVLIENHLLLTAAHCNYPYILINGKEAAVFKVNEQSDLLLLYVPQECPCVPVDKGHVHIGEHVYTLGYPFGATLGFLQVLSDGYVQGYVKKGSMPEIEGYMVSTVPVEPGNSGGGVFLFHDGQFYVVSIVSRGSPNLSIFPSLEMVRALLGK